MESQANYPPLEEGNGTTQQPKVELSDEDLVRIVDERRAALSVVVPKIKTLEEATARLQRHIQNRTPAEEEAIKASLIEKDRQRRFETMQELVTRIGKRYSKCSLKNYEVSCPKQQKVLDSIKDYADHTRERIEAGVGVVIFGPSGTGKDHLLTALALHAIWANKRVMWRNGQDLLGAFRDLISSNDSEEEFIHNLSTPDVLIISDPLPPSGTLTDYQASMFYRLIDRRYRAAVATWVTMNVVSGEEAEQRMGVAIVDRLRDGALCLFCNWPSHRKTQVQL